MRRWPERYGMVGDINIKLTFIALSVVSLASAQDRNRHEEQRRSDRVVKAQRKLDEEFSSFNNWCHSRGMILTINRAEYVCVAPPPQQPAPPKPEPPKVN